MDKIKDAFDCHAPTWEQQERYRDIRARFKATAAAIADTVPDSREKALAATKLKEAAMWADKAIALHRE